MPVFSFPCLRLECTREKGLNKVWALSLWLRWWGCGCKGPPGIFPLSPASPASLSPPPFPCPSQARLSPAWRRASGGVKRDSAGLLWLPYPSLQWTPLQVRARMKTAGAELPARHPPHTGLLRVQVQGFRAGPSLSFAWEDHSLPLIPHCSEAGIWSLTHKEALSCRRCRRGWPLSSQALAARGEEPRCPPFLQPPLPQEPRTGPQAGKPGLWRKVRFPACTRPNLTGIPQTGKVGVGTGACRGLEDSRWERHSSSPWRRLIPYQASGVLLRVSGVGTTGGTRHRSLLFRIPSLDTQLRESQILIC